MDALQLRGHYLVAGELASVYVDVSRKHIMPGVDEIDRLSVVTGDGNSHKLARAKARAIQDYARKAQKDFNTMTAMVTIDSSSVSHRFRRRSLLSVSLNSGKRLFERSYSIKNESSS